MLFSALLFSPKKVQRSNFPAAASHVSTDRCHKLQLLCCSVLNFKFVISVAVCREFIVVMIHSHAKCLSGLFPPCRKLVKVTFNWMFSLLQEISEKKRHEVSGLLTDPVGSPAAKLARRILPGKPLLKPPLSFYPLLHVHDKSHDPQIFHDSN